MLIRFVVENFFSFGKQKEFTTIPNTRLKTLNYHKYPLDNNFEILKLSSIYGANASGKSNLIKSLSLFQDLVVENATTLLTAKNQFKFNLENEKQVLAIEFIQESNTFYYGIELRGEIVCTEELYLSGLGKKADQLIFERKTDKKKKTTINFSPEFEQDEKSQVLKAVLLEEFVKPNKLILKLISNRDNIYLKKAKKHLIGSKEH